jgi:hypothetical protein
VSPANGATNVSTVTPVTVQFSHGVNVATALGEGLVLRANGETVASTLTFNLPNTVATLLPRTRWPPACRTH